MRQVPHEEDIRQLYIASPPLTQRTRQLGRILLFSDPSHTALYGVGDIGLGMDETEALLESISSLACLAKLRLPTRDNTAKCQMVPRHVQFPTRFQNTVNRILEMSRIIPDVDVRKQASIISFTDSTDSTNNSSSKNKCMFRSKARAPAPCVGPSIASAPGRHQRNLRALNALGITGRWLEGGWLTN